ncbi:hypothetical protein QVD17_07238 [Tagetes erecta]|uniref:Uncharacterized protein n=1 Tax=Tagetes erecta TaxID=13708 RepID=A0AAD8LHF7_TARER|nr:hypothetical protein QVD17_07238 [Tagetes erecta]
MSRETPSDGAYKTRSALEDVTNQPGKRGFCLISSSDVQSGDEGFHFAKKECHRADNFNKENNNDEIAECVLRPHSYSVINSMKENISDNISKILCEIKMSCPPGVRQNANDVVSDSYQPTHLVQTIPLDESGSDVIVEDERTDSAVIPQIASNETVENNLGVNDGNDASLDILDSSKDEYLDWPESQESKCGFDSCIGQKGDGLSSAGIDMIKACSCSVCTKAVCIWSDLHYQDIKGRIAAIKKSQKEAAVLVNRNRRDVARNLEKFSNLESDLAGRWTSLFLHMAEIFVREGTQLEKNLSTLKEIIDDCKTGLEKN